MASGTRTQRGQRRSTAFPKAQFNAGLGAGSQTCGQENPCRHWEHLSTRASGLTDPASGFSLVAARMHPSTPQGEIPVPGRGETKRPPTQGSKGLCLSPRGSSGRGRILWPLAKSSSLFCKHIFPWTAAQPSVWPVAAFPGRFRVERLRQRPQGL